MTLCTCPRPGCQAGADFHRLILVQQWGIWRSLWPAVLPPFAQSVVDQQAAAALASMRAHGVDMAAEEGWGVVMGATMVLVAMLGNDLPVPPQLLGQLATVVAQMAGDKLTVDVPDSS